jgi:hypothetical protein
MDELIAEEEKVALPPLFQLSRVLMLFGANAVILWLYLRYGTESWRGAPFLPFGVAGVLLLTLGLGLNARHDPDAPVAPERAWTRAVCVGVAALLVVVGLAQLAG